MISSRGIEASPDQVQAILELQPPGTVRGVQQLTGMVAALGRFIAKSSDRCFPFFRALKKGRSLFWDSDCANAFEELKSYIANIPVLLAPKEGDELILYLSVSDRAISSVLITEEGNLQRPVYYVSKVMHDAESRYLLLEKIVLSLVTAARKLRHYFLAHTVRVRTNYPIKAILKKADFTGRMTKWSIELSEFDIIYEPRKAIKGQALADFLSEHTKNMDTEITETNWQLFVDGSSNSKRSGLGVLLVSPEGLLLEKSVCLEFRATNNESEYEALLYGLKMATALGAVPLKVYSDSQLVVSQVRGEYETHGDRMHSYKKLVDRELEFLSPRPEIVHIPREENIHADALAKLASATESGLARSIIIDSLPIPSIEIKGEVKSLRKSSSWMDPIIGYLSEHILPEDKQEALKLQRRATRFWLSPPPHRALYKRSVSGPYLKCVHPDDVEKFLFEIHEGVCGSHVGGRSLAHRALSQGYWWPYMQKDALNYVAKCSQCQKHSSNIHQPSRELSTITSPWPFAQWGMDIVGPFPLAPGSKKFLLVATDYFTKWIEAEPLVRIRDTDIINFVFKNIFTRFGIPRTLITDNGAQFDSKKFREFCSSYGVKNVYSTPAYPQSNGQAEVSNRTILDGIKKRLSKAKGRWTEELLSVLWAYRTTPRRSTGQSPFFLAYGTEAIIPLEIGLPTLRTENFDLESNNEQLQQNLDFLEERREQALIRLTAYQKQSKKYYDQKVQKREFQKGDLVLRKVVGNTRDAREGKLGSNWEGPYRIISVGAQGSYRLCDMEGKELYRPWNIANLRKFYV